MAQRVYTADVRVVIDTDLTDLSAFIAAATAQVDIIAAVGVLSSALLKEIERYLAAHYTAIRDRQLSKVVMLDTEHSYDGKTGTGLNATLWGQQALAMDTTGTLAAGVRRRASVSYVGAVASNGTLSTD